MTHASDPALARLVEGNRRFSAGTLQHPRQSAHVRGTLLAGQRPFAAVLGCSDSRVPPEVIFDAGLGDLFVVRVAGDVASDEALGSIEYAARHLEVPLVVVLGHTHCGAVAAAMAGGIPEGHLGGILARIREAMDDDSSTPEIIARVHAARTAHALRTAEPYLSALVEEGRLRVVAAVYHMETGEVEFLP